MDKKIKILKILSFIPVILFILFTFVLIMSNEAIDYVKLIISLVLLIITSIGVNNKNKYIIILGFSSLIGFSIWYGIMGYYDYLKWISTIIGIIVLIYYNGVYFFIKKLNY